MFELHTSYDLLASVSQFIYSYRQSVGISQPQVINPRIINQEKGGLIIFVWNDVDKDKSSTFVTHFGLYEPDTQMHTVVYTYEKKVKVVSCSLNQERTLLAFSIVKPKDSGSDKKHKDVHQAFLAELQSMEKIIFSLNMERSSFIKVQFLYPDQDSQSHNRDSDMLVFLHKESIGLYKVPMARIGDRGIMMSSQPKTEQIVRKFVWCQWDAQNQRLHFIQNIRMDGGSDSISQKMSSIQFYNKGRFENMIDIPINFPFPYIRSADKPHYGDIPLHPGIPELTLNISVLTQSSGTFCLCYHKLLTEPKLKSGGQTPSDTQDVEYYISLVHHAKTLYGCVSHLPRHVVATKRLVFSWLGSYLVVMLPGFFVHLLNVGPSFEPCHHILLHNPKAGYFALDDEGRPVSVSFSFGDTMNDQASRSGTPSVTSLASPSPETHPSTPSSHGQPSVILAFSEQCAAMKTLLPCQSFVRESGSTAQHLYDYRSGCLLKLVLNPDLMLESFLNAYWQTRLAMLHYLILHGRDFFTIKRLFEILIENLTNSELNSMFTEYLVASTFAEMKKQVSREILNILSFTSTQTLRGQFEKNLSGDRIAHISYLSLEIVDLSKRSSKEHKNRSAEDFWDTLIRRLRLRHSEIPPRFSHMLVMRLYRQAEIEEAGGKTLWGPMHVEDSFFDGVFSLKPTEILPSLRRKSGAEANSSDSTSGRRSKIDTIFGSAPLFLQTQISPESKLFKRRLSLLTEDLLTKHLSRYLGKETRSKAKNIAKEYLLCQAKVSRQLCHLIWSLRGLSLSQQMEDTLLPNLQEPATDEEYELFQLYERFYLSAGDLGYPLPLGFSSFFTSLGFKCLELHLFFQYVDNHILSLTPDFILQLLSDLPDDVDEEVPQLKFQVISRLPKPFATECFERWNHPMVQQRKAREQVAEILLHGQRSSTGQQEAGAGQDHSQRAGRNSAASLGDTAAFPPLNTLMKHLDSLAGNMSTNRSIAFDSHLIEEAALQHTQAQTLFDLSSVNF